MDRQAKETLRSGKHGILWAAHQIDLPYSHIERLVNLKIKGGSAGPARIVTLVTSTERMKKL